MSRGLGKTQHRILGELDKMTDAGLSVTQLAELLGCTDAQIRRAVYALNSRGLVVLVKESRSHGTALVVWDRIKRDEWLVYSDPHRAMIEQEMRRRGVVAVLRALWE